jgi:hypothetical protein
VLSVLLLGLSLVAGCGDEDSDEAADQPAASTESATPEVPEPGEGTEPVGATLRGEKAPVFEKTPAPTVAEVRKAPTDGSLECAPGYSLVRAGDKASCETDEISKASGGTQLANNRQSILNGTHQLAKEYADYVLASSTSDPITYWYLIYPQDCTMVSGDTGRCLIYLWKMTYATGYGAGGVDTGVFREHFFATHVGNNTYSTKIVMVDFIDPYYWECSDTPRANTPRCN